MNTWILLFVCMSTIYAQPTPKDTLCGSNGNTDTICSPKTNDVWKNGTWYPITWNSMYPTYVSAGELSIYVYFVKNYQKIQIKQWSNIDPTEGNLPVLVDDTWRLNSSEATNYDCLVYIVPTQVDPLKEMNNMFSDYPTAISFHVAQVALSPISTALPTSTTSILPTSTVLPTITSLPSQPTIQPTKDNLQPWIISAICIASLAALGTCFSLGWIFFRKKQWSQKPKEDTLPPYVHPLNNASSMTMVNPSQGRQTRLQSCTSLSKEPFLTSNDAHILANAFRETMRCPEWQTEQDRRRAGDALLKKELEIEGTLMKKVGKKFIDPHTMNK